MRIVCFLLGHKWENIWRFSIPPDAFFNEPAIILYRCRRCGETKVMDEE